MLITALIIDSHKRSSQRLANALQEMRYANGNLVAEVARLKRQAGVDACDREIRIWFSEFEKACSLAELATSLVTIIENGVSLAEFFRAYALAPSTDLDAIFATIQQMRREQAFETWRNRK